MQSGKLWLILSVVGFLAWIGYLGYLVLDLKADGYSPPIFLSRPQFLIVDTVVIAEVNTDEEGPFTAKVTEVVWSRDANAKRWEGKDIGIENLPGAPGLKGSGTYILPLIHLDDPFRIAPIPFSPGFPAANRPPGDPYPHLVYPSTPSTKEQLKQILDDPQPR